MRRTDFNYDLPEELIAQQPLAERSASRMLTLEGATGAIADRRIRDLPDLVKRGDLLIFNDTRVIPARLFGEKDTGGKVEILVERLLGERELLAQVRASKPSRPGTLLAIEGAGERLRVEAIGFQTRDDLSMHVVLGHWAFQASSQALRRGPNAPGGS